jgi:hypothetical protein
MKAIGSLAFGIALSVCASAGAASVASLVLAKPTEPPLLKSASAPDLWTATPVRIDRNQQNYERLPPVYSTYVTNPVSAKITSGRLAPTAPISAASHTGLSAAHLDWCSSRYRSYNPETNAYRSYGGQIRACQSPYAAKHPIDKDQTAQIDRRFVGYATANPRTASCTARDQSYRADDNSYQPYNGPRRPCLHPSQDARLEASNSVWPVSGR